MRSGDINRGCIFKERAYSDLLFYIRDLQSILNQNIHISNMIPPGTYSILQHFSPLQRCVIQSKIFPLKSIGGVAFFIGNLVTGHFLNKYFYPISLHIILVLMIPILSLYDVHGPSL
jgi:hypothetical protein